MATVTHVTPQALDAEPRGWLSRDMTDQGPDPEVIAYQERVRRLRIELQDLREAQERRQLRVQ